MVYNEWHTKNNTMDRNKMEELNVAQHKDEVLALSEFDFPFPKVDILSKVGVVILHLQGFKVVNIVGVDQRRHKLAILMYMYHHSQGCVCGRAQVDHGDDQECVTGCQPGCGDPG